MNGNIKSVFPHKGFGFVQGDDGKDYFFHQTDFIGFWDHLIRDFEVWTMRNQKIKVSFTPVQLPKGPRARNVNRLDWPNAPHQEVTKEDLPR